MMFWDVYPMLNNVMKISRKLLGLRGLMGAMGVYTAVWITLEGSLWQVVVMGVGWTAVFLLYLIQKQWGGRLAGGWRWVVIGLLMGLGSGVLTLFFMVIKTGLHAHGPEFTPDEIVWALNQIPIWTVAGLLTGLGLFLLTKPK